AGARVRARRLRDGVGDLRPGPELRRPRRGPRGAGPRRGVPLARRTVHPPGHVPRRPRAHAGAGCVGGADRRRRGHGAPRGRRSPEPLIPRELLRSRTTLAANTMMLIGAAGLFAMFFFLTLYMQIVLGWGALETGAAYLPFSFIMAVTSGVVAKSLDGRSA